MKKLFLNIFLLFSLAVFSQPTQFRGFNRNGIYSDTGLLKQWPEGGPKLIMSVEGIGKGWSSAILSDGIIYVTGMKDTTDYLSAVSLDGQILWQKPYGRSWTKSFPDTRCTPTVEEDRIYVLSGSGELSCFNKKDGTVIWFVDVDKSFGSKWHTWGIAESPLIVDNKVICTPAGEKTTVVAFDKLTGELIWQSPSLNDTRSYVSPVIYEYKDLRYILAQTIKYLIAVDPETGEIIWKFLANENKKGANTIPINTPIYWNDEIFVCNGYNYPSIMLKVAEDGKSVSLNYRNQTFDNHHDGLVLVDKYVYGSNWINNSQGKWVCMNWDTGEIHYEADWFTKGPIISADGMLYVVEEKRGNFGLVKPNPSGFEIVSTFVIPMGKGLFWAHPTIYDGKLFIRHGDALMVFNIKQ